MNLFLDTSYRKEIERTFSESVLELRSKHMGKKNYLDRSGSRRLHNARCGKLFLFTVVTVTTAGHSHNVTGINVCKLCNKGGRSCPRGHLSRHNICMRPRQPPGQGGPAHVTDLQILGWRKLDEECGRMSVELQEYMCSWGFNGTRWLELNTD